MEWYSFVAEKEKQSISNLEMKEKAVGNTLQ